MNNNVVFNTTPSPTKFRGKLFRIACCDSRCFLTNFAIEIQNFAGLKQIDQQTFNLPELKYWNSKPFKVSEFSDFRSSFRTLSTLRKRLSSLAEEEIRKANQGVSWSGEIIISWLCCPLSCCHLRCMRSFQIYCVVNSECLNAHSGYRRNFSRRFIRTTLSHYAKEMRSAKKLTAKSKRS